MKFSQKGSREFGWEGIRGWAYSSKDDFPNMSCACINVTGRHGKTKNIRCDRVYFVTEGRGEFTVNGKKTGVKRNDAVIIPRGTPYDYGGKMKLVLVDSPAFEPEGDVKLE